MIQTVKAIHSERYIKGSPSPSPSPSPQGFFRQMLWSHKEAGSECLQVKPPVDTQYEEGSSLPRGCISWFEKHQASAAEPALLRNQSPDTN